MICIVDVLTNHFSARGLTYFASIAMAHKKIYSQQKLPEPPEKVWRLLSQIKLFDPKEVSSSSPYIYHPLLVFSSSLLMKTSCLRLKLVELNFFASFSADDQSKLTYLTLLNKHPSRQDELFQTKIAAIFVIPTSDRGQHIPYISPPRAWPSRKCIPEKSGYT